MRLAVAGLLTGAAAIALVWLTGRDPAASRAPSLATETVAAAPEPPPATARPVPGDADPLPASLRDTEIDGELHVGAGGRFEPTPGALRLFDYFLSASGEEPPDRIRARIAGEIARRLPPGAAREAAAFLDRYLAYRDAVRRLSQDDRIAESADLERRLQWLRELRREHFGAALADVLFGEEERAAEIAAERRRIAADPRLDAEQKQSLLEALDAAQPDATRPAREAATAAIDLAHDEQALRARGASDAELHALRAERFGADAAERLAALDTQRAAWQQRLADYRAARDALRADASLDDAERARRLAALRAERFDEREQLRLDTIEAMEAGFAAPPAAP